MCEERTDLYFHYWPINNIQQEFLSAPFIPVGRCENRIFPVTSNYLTHHKSEKNIIDTNICMYVYIYIYIYIYILGSGRLTCQKSEEDVSSLGGKGEGKSKLFHKIIIEDK